MAGEFTANQVAEYQWSLTRVQWEKLPTKTAPPREPSDGVIMRGPDASLWCVVQPVPGRYTFTLYFNADEGAYLGQTLGLSINGTSVTVGASTNDSETVLNELANAIIAEAALSGLSPQATVVLNNDPPPTADQSTHALVISLETNAVPTLAANGVLEDFYVPATAYSIEVYGQAKNQAANGPGNAWVLIAQEEGSPQGSRFRVSAMDKAGLLGDVGRIFVRQTALTPANGRVNVHLGTGQGAAS